MSEQLRDLDVRQAAYTRLLHHAQRHPDTLVVNELGLDHGSCRIDVAVINGSIRAFEIKAEADTLSRLPHQVAAYGQVVNRATLIVAPRHLEAATAIVPSWWGIVTAQRGSRSGVVFRRVRADLANRNTDPMMLARLLWRPEAVGLLRGLGHSESSLRKPREILYGYLTKDLSRRALASAVCAALKRRVSWRGPSQSL